MWHQAVDIEMIEEQAFALGLEEAFGLVETVPGSSLDTEADINCRTPFAHLGDSDNIMKMMVAEKVADAVQVAKPAAVGLPCASIDLCAPAEQVADAVQVATSAAVGLPGTSIDLCCTPLQVARWEECPRVGIIVRFMHLLCLVLHVLAIPNHECPPQRSRTVSGLCFSS